MFENITKNVIIKNSTVINANCNESKGDIKTVAQCYCGFDMGRTAKEAVENAEFIAFCFNLQQKYDISKLDYCVKQIESVISLSDLWTYGDIIAEEHKDEAVILNTMKLNIQELLTKVKK